MIPVVFDCNVILQAMLRAGSPAFACLERTETKPVRLQLSADLLAEYRDVLTRPKLVKKFPILATDQATLRLEQVVARSEFHFDVPAEVKNPRDPDDEPYLNLAVASNARYLVTRDLDLLDLMKDEAFTTSYPQLSICDPVQFLTFLDSIEISR